MNEVRAATAGHYGSGQNAVDLHAIGNTAIRESLGERRDRGIDRANGRVRGLREKCRVARHEDDGTFGFLECRPCRDRQPACAVQLEVHAGIPLLIGHLKDVDLWHRACDVQQRVDTTKFGERLIDDLLRRSDLGKIEINDEWFSTGGADSSCATDALAGTGDDRD